MSKNNPYLLLVLVHWCSAPGVTSVDSACHYLHSFPLSDLSYRTEKETTCQRNPPAKETHPSNATGAARDDALTRSRGPCEDLPGITTCGPVTRRGSGVSSPLARAEAHHPPLTGAGDSASPVIQGLEFSIPRQPGLGTQIPVIRGSGLGMPC